MTCSQPVGKVRQHFDSAYSLGSRVLSHTAFVSAFVTAVHKGSASDSAFAGFVASVYSVAASNYFATVVAAEVCLAVAEARFAVAEARFAAAFVGEYHNLMYPNNNLNQ